MTLMEWSTIMGDECKEWRKTAPRLTYEEAYGRFCSLGLIGSDRDDRMKILNIGLWITATLVDFDDMDFHFDARPCFLDDEGHLTKMKVGPLVFEL